MAIVVCMAILVLAGFNPSAFSKNAPTGLQLNSANANQPWISGVYYDSAGVAKCYFNGTAIHESGQIIGTVAILGKSYANWANASSTRIGIFSWINTFPLYSDAYGQNRLIWGNLQQQGINQGGNGSSQTSIGWEDITGLLAFVVALSAIIVVASIHFFGSGISDFALSVMYKVAAYMGSWGVFSALAYGCFAIIPFPYNCFLWFVLTIMLCFGIFNSVGHPSGDSGGGGDD